MKTLVYANAIALDELTLVERPVPTPGPRDVLLRVDAVSLNFRDLAIARGEYGAFAAPLVPGSDGAGEVVAVGAEVRRFAEGDRIAPAYVPDWVDGPVRAEVARRRLGGPVDGVLSEYVCVHEDAAVRLPSYLTPSEAATLPIAGVSVWQALVTDTGLRAGDVVGVTGTGGTSVFAAQIARAAGARVIVVGRDVDKLGRLSRMGADVVVQGSAGEVSWTEKVLELTGGAGVDSFLDVVGGDSVRRAIEATRVGGTVTTFGFVGASTATLDLIATLRRAVTLRATSGGSRASFEALLRAMEIASMRPVVDRTFDFSVEGVKAGLQHLERGRPFGKVVVRIR
jgi:NADPH:quinone reductase-like Zn-dependent oxidoreductase